MAATLRSHAAVLAPLRHIVRYQMSIRGVSARALRLKYRMARDGPTVSLPCKPCGLVLTLSVP